MDILKVEITKIENEVLKLSIREQLKAAYESSDEDLEYVREEFSTFCKNQQLKKALLNSVDLLKAGDFDGIKHLVESALKAGNDKNIGHEYNKDIESSFREDARSQLLQHHGKELMIYFKEVSEMEILALYLVIQEVVNLGV